MNKQFIKNIMTLASGTAFAQFVLLMISPILTRLYSAEQFGTFGVFISVLTILLVLSSLKYELAMPLTKLRQAAKLLYQLCVLLTVSISLILALCIAVWGSWLLEASQLSLSIQSLYLLPVTLLICGLFQSLHFYGIKFQRFKLLSASKMTQALVVACGQLSLAGSTALGLIWGHISGFFAALVLFLIRDRSTLKVVKVNRKRLVWAAKRYIKFPKYTLWASLANTSGTMLPVVLFAAFYPPSLVGLYVLAHRMLFAPVTLIGNAIGNVFMSHAKSYYDEGTLAQHTVAIHRKLTLMSLPLLATFLPFLPAIFAFVFGAEWFDAGVLASYIAIWVYFVFTASPISTVLVAMEKQKLAAYFDFASCGLRLGGVVLFASFYAFSFHESVMFFSALNALIVIGFILLVFSQLKVSLMNIFFMHSKEVMLIGAPSFLINYLLFTTPNLLTFLITAAFTLPLGYLRFRKLL